MTPPDSFETDRLLLRAPLPSDAAAIHANYATDPEVTRYLIWTPHKSMQETEAFLVRCVEGWKTGAEFSWAIIWKETGELVGMLGLRLGEFKADVGYALARKFWGKGIATEALTQIVNWTLALPDIYRVWALCDVENTASARVLEKVGMKREGIMRRATMHPNVSEEPRDSYCYAITK
jgi:RimJ/RimL family protein N-acetyltransferase